MNAGMKITLDENGRWRIENNGEVIKGSGGIEVLLKQYSIGEAISQGKTVAVDRTRIYPKKKKVVREIY